MGAAPDAVRQPSAVVIRDREREQELRRDDAQCDPQRPVAGEKRDDDRPDRKRQPGIDRDREDVNRDEAADEQADEPVDVLDHEPRPAGKRLLAGHRQAE